MFHTLPRWMGIVLITFPLFLILLCGGIIVSERIFAMQRNNRVAQELGLDPAQRLASARHCEILRCRTYQWFPTVHTLAEFEQRVTHTAYQPMFQRQPWNRGEQSWGIDSIHSYTRHQFTQNGSRAGRMETIQWGLTDEAGRLIILYFHPIQHDGNIYMFDNQHIQENMVTIIMDQ